MHNTYLFTELFQVSIHNEWIGEIFTAEILPCTWITTSLQKSNEQTNQGKLQKQFDLFSDTFGKCLISASKWKSQFWLNSNTVFSDVISVTDEAFCILTIEGNWDAWMDEIKTGVKQKIRSGKYTESNSNKKYGGWTKEGMARFNRLCQTINELRQSNTRRKEMERQYKKSKQPIMSTKKSGMPNDNELDDESEEEECWNELNVIEKEDERNQQGAHTDGYNTLCDQTKIAQNFNVEDKGIRQDAYHQDAHMGKYYNYLDQKLLTSKLNFDPEAKNSSGGESSVEDNDNDDIVGSVHSETFQDSESLDVPNINSIDC